MEQEGAQVCRELCSWGRPPLPNLAPGQRPSRQRAAPPTPSLKQDVKTQVLAAGGLLNLPFHELFPGVAGCPPALANYFLLTPVPPALLIGGIITHFPSLKAAAGWVLLVETGIVFWPRIDGVLVAGGGISGGTGLDPDCPAHPPSHLPHL